MPAVQGERRPHRSSVSVVLIALGFLLTVPGAAPAQQRVQETVVVTGTAAPVPFESLSRTVRVVTREELAGLPVTSAADAIRLVAGIDVRARGPHGVQVDLAARGATFGQSVVLVDGVRLNNSQTGHHNGDLPVTLDQIERIEVLLGPGSSLYGADAFGGTVNIVTRRAAGAPSLTLRAGGDGYLAAAAGAGFAKAGVAQHVSVSADRSDGFEFARDFDTFTVGSQTRFGRRTAVDVGVADKAFGANGFYGDSPSREWTQQVMTSVQHEIASGPARALSAQVWYRTHRDRFLWDVRRPGLFENLHRTHNATAALRGHAGLGAGWRVSGGLEHAADWIRSSNLGDHQTAHTAAFVEAQGALGPRATLAGGTRVDRYTTVGTAWSPTLSGSLWVSSAVRVRASVARAFRVPTFTERYYRDPMHLATADLSPERAWSTEIAGDWVPHAQWLVTAAAFDRRERDVIDWVRATSSDRWRTANLRDVRTRGIEASVQRVLGEGARVSAEYAFTDVDPESLTLLSKYTLDYARHAFVVGASAPLPWRLAAGARLDARQRTDRDAYLLVDLRLSRPVGSLVVFVDGTNLLDVRYQEIRGVNMPGRWFSAGLQWRK